MTSTPRRNANRCVPEQRKLVPAYAFDVNTDGRIMTPIDTHAGCGGQWRHQFSGEGG
jgi:hypothetical protein